MSADCSATPVVPPSESSPPLAGWWLELAERLSLCSRQLRQAVAQHGVDPGLSEAELALLWACRLPAARGQSQKELAERLCVSPAHVSGLVEQLREAGLLVSQRDGHDRRRQLWQLTPRGEARLQAVVQRLAGWAASCASCPDPQELVQRLEPLANFLAGQAPAEAVESVSGSGLDAFRRVIGASSAWQRGAA